MVRTNSELQLRLRSVSDFEAGDAAEQVEGAVGDLCGVACSIPHGNPRHNHVGVAYRLHLHRTRNTN